MLRSFVLGVFVIFCGVSRAFAFGLTADQMYRNLLTSEKGQVQSASLSSGPLLSFKKADSKPEAIWQEKKVYFEKKTQKPADFDAECRQKKRRNAYNCTRGKNTQNPSV